MSEFELLRLAARIDADELMRQLEPVLCEIVDRYGVTLSCFLLRGVLSRLERGARIAGQWDEKQYSMCEQLEKLMDVEKES